MLAERDLIALLYRADWTRLSLSGEVSGIDEALLTMITHLSADGPFPPFPPFPPPGFGAPGPHLTRLLVAPGRRYRKDGPDGHFAQGCDGEQIWQWWLHPPPGDVQLSGSPEPPFPTLLCPSWLLTGYDLEVGEAVSACGRDGVRVVATARRGTGPAGTIRFPPFRPWPPVRFDHVEAIVDAELGILLRCERRQGDRAAELIEFRSITVDPVPGPEQFAAPAGSIFGDGNGRPFGGPLRGGPFSGGPFSGGPFSGVGWEIAKTAAGLAAGGLGATIRYSPFGPFGPLRSSRSSRPRADDGDTEAAMPHDDPEPEDAADGPPVSDEVLHLLYRGGAVAPAFTATLHEWLDFGALLAAVPPSARKAGFGGVGFLLDTLGAAAREGGEQQATTHLVSSVRIEGWDSYRIDRTYRTPRHRDRHNTRDDDWVTAACDGRQRYLVYADRVRVGPAGPPPTELTDLADGSWLLGCQLSGGSEIMAGDRRAYCISVSASRSASSLMKFFCPAVAVLDAESGRLLRLTCYGAGNPVARYELRDIADGGDIDVGFEVPEGLPIVDEPSGDDRPPPPVNLVTSMAKAAADVFKRRADDKAAAARDFYDARRPNRPPQP
jgi:hypothetical protein